MFVSYSGVLTGKKKDKTERREKSEFEEKKQYAYIVAKQAPPFGSSCVQTDASVCLNSKNMTVAHSQAASVRSRTRTRPRAPSAQVPYL